MNLQHYIQNQALASPIGILLIGGLIGSLWKARKFLQLIPCAAAIALFVHKTAPNSQIIQGLGILFGFGMLISCSSMGTRLFAYSSIPTEKWSPHRWLFSSFMHTGFMHLSLNLLSLHFIYVVVSKSYTDLQMAKISLLMILIYAIARSLLEGILKKQPMISVGASTWICGWFGLMAIMQPKLKLAMFYVLNLPIRDAVLLLLAFSFVLGIARVRGGVDHMGHGFGILAGFVVAVILPILVASFAAI